MTDNPLAVAAAEFLAAVARLSDNELHQLHESGWRLAHGLTDEPTQPRVAAVLHRAAVILSEEQDRRRHLTEWARHELDDGREAGCLTFEWTGPDLGDLATD
jgi:hypothetical protein